jgi:hypothetical protein
MDGLVRRVVAKRGFQLSRWLALAVLVLAVAPISASGQAVPDASCPGPREDSFVWLSPSGGGNNRVAQTFTSQASGALTMAQASVIKTGSSANWVMQINEVDGSGTPTNTVLAATTVPDSTVPSGEATITGSFATPAAVNANQAYALVVTRPGSDHLEVGVRKGDDCPGQLFSSSPTGPFSPFMDWDLVFTVFVEPPPPGPEASPKSDRTVTLDSNKNKVKKGKKVRLSGRLSAAARQGPCESGQTVELQRKRPKQTTFTTFAQVQTDAQGSFSLKKKLKKTFEFRAQVVETATCTSALSNSEKVKVKKK